MSKKFNSGSDMYKSHRDMIAKIMNESNDFDLDDMVDDKRYWVEYEDSDDMWHVFYDDGNNAKSVASFVDKDEAEQYVNGLNDEDTVVEDLKDYKDDYSDLDESADRLEKIKKDPRSIKNIKNPSEEEQLAAVKGHYRSIYSIDNPNEKVQLASIYASPISIKYIKNPTDKVKRIANAALNKGYEYESIPDNVDLDESADRLEKIKKDPRSIKNIKNPSEEEQLAAVKGHYRSIYSIDNPNEKVQLASIYASPISIKYIKNPTDKVKRIANAALNKGYEYESIPDNVDLDESADHPEDCRCKMCKPSIYEGGERGKSQDEFKLYTDYETKAQKEIENESDLALEVAEENGMIFDNVSHMSWFVQAVADRLKEEDKLDEKDMNMGHIDTKYELKKHVANNFDHYKDNIMRLYPQDQLRTKNVFLKFLKDQNIDMEEVKDLSDTLAKKIREVGDAYDEMAQFLDIVLRVSQ